MNTYSLIKSFKCPSNGLPIVYNIEITHAAMITVESILDYLSEFETAYHENLADELFLKFGGEQVITANHHGVSIKTVRK